VRQRATGGASIRRRRTMRRRRSGRRYEPVLQVAEIMLTLVTVIDPPRPAPVVELELAPLLDGDDDEALLDGDDEDDEDELLGEDELSIAPLPPDMRPVTITWCPTCSDRFTEESAVRRMSFAPPVPLIEPAVRLLGSAELEPAVPDVEPDAVEPEAVPEAEPEPLALVPEVEPEAPELELVLPLPIFAFFSTKPPPEPALLDAVLELLVLLSRWRQPVAVTCPAVSLDDRPVDWLPGELDVGGWLLCGVDDVGDWAASVPHSATPLHSVTAHCQ
jgi:hypothetical protein